MKNGWINFSSWNGVGVQEITSSFDPETVSAILNDISEKTNGQTKIGTIHSGLKAEEAYLITDFIQMAPRLKLRTFDF